MTASKGRSQAQPPPTARVARSARPVPTHPPASTSGLTARVRATRQGAAVEAVLADATGFRSAQDLHAELRRRGDPVGLTTVYRHLTYLAEGGSVDMLYTDDGESVYRLCESQVHHHHVVCRRCGASVEVDGPEVEAWAARVATGAGYSDVSHRLELFGTCASCARPQAGRKRSRS